MKPTRFSGRVVDWSYLVRNRTARNLLKVSLARFEYGLKIVLLFYRPHDGDTAPLQDEEFGLVFLGPVGVDDAPDLVDDGLGVGDEVPGAHVVGAVVEVLDGAEYVGNSLGQVGLVLVENELLEIHAGMYVFHPIFHWAFGLFLGPLDLRALEQRDFTASTQTAA